MGNCAGIDWASEKHDVLIEDPAGGELLAETFVHDEDGVSALCGALACFDVEPVAIERPDGLLVDRLLDAGMRVLALHPNQVKAARERFRASGGKSDRFDRFVLCELARTDSHRFRILEPDCEQTKALRALVRARGDLVGARVAPCNQLRAELQLFWPDQPPLRIARLLCPCRYLGFRWNQACSSSFSSHMSTEARVPSVSAASIALNACPPTSISWAVSRYCSTTVVP